MVNFNDAVESRNCEMLTGVMPRDGSDGSCPPVQGRESKGKPCMEKGCGFATS